MRVRRRRVAREVRRRERQMRPPVAHRGDGCAVPRADHQGRLRLELTVELDAWTAAVAALVHDDPEDLDFDGLLLLVGDELLDAIRRTLAMKSPGPARMTAVRIRVADYILDGEIGTDDDGGLNLWSALALLVAWFTSARDDQDDPQMVASAIAWVSANLGPEAAHAAERAGAILGDRFGAAVAIERLAGQLGEDLLPALIWLTAAVVERYGRGDVSWLDRDDMP
jgi:hypothetical protein